MKRIKAKVPTKPLLRDYYGKRIASAWRAALAYQVATQSLLDEAKRKLTPGEFKRLQKDLRAQFPDSTN